jgi:hypothetical protein
MILRNATDKNDGLQEKISERVSVREAAPIFQTFPDTNLKLRKRGW